MFFKFKFYKILFRIFQSKFPKTFIQNLSRSSLMLFSQISTIFFIFFRNINKLLEENYEILKKIKWMVEKFF